MTASRATGLLLVVVLLGCETEPSVGDSAAALTDSDESPHGARKSDAGSTGSAGSCSQRQLKFSADSLPDVPSPGSSWVWGGNATGGGSELYSSEFTAAASRAHAAGALVFAYLEGPCGDTGGHDDGERGRCEGIHNAFNTQNAPGTPNTPEARWKPFTLMQMQTAAQNNVDYCEIDNLENNVTIPLNPLLREIKTQYEEGRIKCRLVLKNVSAEAIESIRSEIARTPAEANFIAPFHIFEANDESQKPALDAAMVALKGPGAVTIISTNTNAYGSAFTRDTFTTCP